MSLFWLIIIICFHTQTGLGQGTQTSTEIISPATATTFTNHQAIEVEAVVHSDFESHYMQLTTPDNANRLIQIGYDPNTVGAPAQDVLLTNNTHIQLTLRTDSAIVWNQVYLRFAQNSKELSQYLPTGGITLGIWQTISVPLSDFTDNFANLGKVQLNPRTPMELDILEIKFTGGTTDFIWFGGDKYDNSHTGVSPQIESSDLVNYEVLTENGLPPGSIKTVKFFADNELIGQDSLVPFKVSFTPSILNGSLPIFALTELTDSTQYTSSAISVLIVKDTASDQISITQPISNRTYIGPTDMPIQADVSFLGEPSYFRLQNPSPATGGNWRFVTMGYDEHSVYDNPQDLTAYGRDSLLIQMRYQDSVPDWNWIGVRIGGDLAKFNTYLPSNVVEGEWFDLWIPLSAFGTADMDSVSNIQLPRVKEWMDFTLEIKQILFTGGTEDLVWYGPAKTVFAHSGYPPGSAPDASYDLQVEMVAPVVLEQVLFYQDSLQVGADSLAPYQTLSYMLDSGSHAFTAVAVYDNGTSQTSETVSINVTDDDAAALEEYVSLHSLLDTAIDVKEVRMEYDSLHDQYVLLFSNLYQLYFVILDSSFNLIAPPTGEQWPIKVNTLSLYEAQRKYSPNLTINPNDGDIGIFYSQFDYDKGGEDAYIRYAIYDFLGRAYPKYALGEHLFAVQFELEYNAYFEVHFGSNNNVYGFLKDDGFEDTDNDDHYPFRLFEVDLSTDSVINQPSLFPDFDTLDNYYGTEVSSFLANHNYLYWILLGFEIGPFPIKYKAITNGDGVNYPSIQLGGVNEPFNVYKADFQYQNQQAVLTAELQEDDWYANGTYESRIFHSKSEAIKNGIAYSGEKTLLRVDWSTDLRFDTYFARDLTLDFVYDDEYKVAVQQYQLQLDSTNQSINYQETSYRTLYNGPPSFMSIIGNGNQEQVPPPIIIIPSPVSNPGEPGPGPPGNVIIFPNVPCLGCESHIKNYILLNERRPAALHPVSDYLNVAFSSRKVSEQITIEFYDDQNKTWLAVDPSHQQTTEVGPNKYSINLNTPSFSLASGTYLVRVRDIENEYYYFRIWKQ